MKYFVLMFSWRTAAVHIEMDKLKDLKNKQSLSSKERGLVKTAFKVNKQTNINKKKNKHKHIKLII